MYIKIKHNYYTFTYIDVHVHAVLLTHLIKIINMVNSIYDIIHTCVDTFIHVHK